MTTIKIAIFSLFLLLGVFLAKAQVTIGIAEEPAKGALLQLKDMSDSPNLLVTASKGLSLPCVELLSTKLGGKINNLSKTIKNAEGNWDGEEHTGLVVYNVADGFCSPQKGLYVWNGTAWKLLDEQEKAEDVRSVVDDGKQITISYSGESTSYYYSKFGDAGIWMTENLATRYLPNGTLLEQKATASLEVPYCFIPGNKASADRSEGLLYNWNAAMDGQVCINIDQGQGNVGQEVEDLNGGGYIKGICPKGWHMPSDREVNAPEREIANNLNAYSSMPNASDQWDVNWETYPSSQWRGKSHGKAMKRTAAPANGASKVAKDGGVDVAMTGYANGSSDRYGAQAYWWTSSAYEDDLVWRRSFAVSRSTEVLRSASDRRHLFSVRCKKD